MNFYFIFSYICRQCLHQPWKCPRTNIVVIVGLSALLCAIFYCIHTTWLKNVFTFSLNYLMLLRNIILSCLLNNVCTLLFYKKLNHVSKYKINLILKSIKDLGNRSTFCDFKATVSRVLMYNAYLSVANFVVCSFLCIGRCAVVPFCFLLSISVVSKLNDIALSWQSSTANFVLMEMKSCLGTTLPMNHPITLMTGNEKNKTEVVSGSVIPKPPPFPFSHTDFVIHNQPYEQLPWQSCFPITQQYL